ncbi:MAG: (Fe-S)-binding protein [Bacteroidota bacterium]
MSFDVFVLPFSIGLLLLFILVVFKISFWVRQLPLRDRIALNKGIFSRKIFKVMGEVIMESLFHRRIYKINPVLGYMHMSFAFGWFMLIVLGNVETRIHSGTELNLPYYAIFFKFFLTEPLVMPGAKILTFLMDFFLLYVLSGVILAFAKRIYSRAVGMKRTTKLKPFDIFAMLSLWLIFPLRLLAESMSAGMYQTGGFMTQPIGNFLVGIMPLEHISYIMWWAYSFALGIFFVCLPYSRYMHIPTEIVLIAFRRFGIRRTKGYDMFKDVEVFSCSRCGICIDVCQLNTMAGVTNIQSAYFIKSIRKKNQQEDIVQNCLVCGRCQEFCPVGIRTDDLRLSQRMTYENQETAAYDYLPAATAAQTDILYFAGCMTHLTPSIKKAMVSILEASGDKYKFMDEDGSVCCGRPMMLSGNIKDAQKLINANKEAIWSSGAHTLVTSCPICLRMFKEDYQLNLKVIHHSQYIDELMKQGRIAPLKNGLKIAYHDPCEMGRGLDIYDEPRSVLQSVGELLQNPHERNNSLCCGGSLGNNTHYNEGKDKISQLVVDELSAKDPDVIATACPLCKKTFVKYAGCRVADIAELVNEGMMKSKLN